MHFGGVSFLVIHMVDDSVSVFIQY
jgi:hypothetical protein